VNLKSKYVLSMTAACALLCATGGNLHAAPILFGGLGGHATTSGPEASANDGSLVIVDQTTGAVSIVGRPDAVARITGLAFDLNGALFASTLGAAPFPPPPAPQTSNLIMINSATGALLSSVPIVAGAGGPAISIADLSVQPGTNALFGIESPNDALGGEGKLYTINKSTGVATLIGNTGFFFGSIAFAPNGTLYMSGANLGPMGGQVGDALLTINPATAAPLTTIPVSDFFGALAFDSTNNTLIGGTGDQHQLFRINPATGAGTLIGDTGLNFIGDLDFHPVPEPATLAMLGFGLLALGIGARKMRRG
jgi:hypothetical protein